jgi:hypothetical protein
MGTIKATELRIGNYITEKNKQNQIYSVSNHNAKNYSNIYPIPLTEEWLLDFGFEKTEVDFKIQIQKNDNGGNTDYWIYIDTGINNETYEFTVQLVSQEGCWFTSKNKYVHQLQNLYFALTQQELTIKK